MEMSVRSQRLQTRRPGNGRALYLRQHTLDRQTGGHAQHGYSILCLDAENGYFHAEEDKEVYCWPPKEWVKWYHTTHFCGRRKAAKKFNEFVSATVGLGLEQCPEHPSLFQRPGTTLIFE